MPEPPKRPIKGPLSVWRSLPPSAYLLALGIGVHLLFLLSLRTGWLNPLFEDTQHRFGPAADFFSIYAAGVKARHGESVYTVGGHVEQVPYAYAFRYMPLVAYTLGAALSLLPALSAYGLWLVLCELALLRNIRLTWERAPDRRTGLLAAALWLLFSPYFLELYVGQFTFLTASLTFWAYLAWQDAALGRRPRAGAWRGGDLPWAGAVCLKMMPLLYMPIALLRGRWKGLVAALALLAASSGLYFARFPHDWAVFVSANADAKPTWHAGNQGLMALLYAAAGERLTPYLQLRTGALVLVGLALLWLTVRALRSVRRAPGGGAVAVARRERDLLLLYAGASAAYCLAYKDVWEHHYVLLLPPLVLLALRRESPWLWAPPFVVSALPGLFFLYDLPGLGYNEDPQAYWHPAVSLLHHAWKPLAPLWLLGGLTLAGIQGDRLRVGRSEGVAEITESGAASARRGWLGRAPALAGLVLLCVTAAGAARWVQQSVQHSLPLRPSGPSLVWPASVFQMQHAASGSGPAALASVCRHYGVPATEEEVAALAGTTPRGTSMWGLRIAAQRKGLAAEGRRVTADGLRTVPCPCLLFFQEDHYAVLTGVRGGRFFLADPSSGQHVWTREQLVPTWRGDVLVVGPAGDGRVEQVRRQAEQAGGLTKL